MPNTEFKHYDYTTIINFHSFIEELILNDIKNDFERLSLESEIEKKILEYFRFSSIELAEIKSVVGQSPFCNKNTKCKFDLNKLDKLLAGSRYLNCGSTSRLINGFYIGSESIFEDLAYKLDVNPKTIYNFIITNLSHFKITKSKYFNDLVHKIILYELGIRSLTSYNYNKQIFDQFIERIRIKYPFLVWQRQKDLGQIVFKILTLHHKTSLF